MCEDCQSMIAEFEELLDNIRILLKTTEDELIELKRKNELLEYKANSYKQVAKAGIPDIIGAWLDKEIDTLITNKTKVNNE